MLAIPFSFTALVALSLVPLAHAHPIENPVENRLPTRWFHHEDHPVHALFRRGDNGEQFEEAGSPAWTEAYPVLTPNATEMPQAWKDALKAAEDAGKIPQIPQSKSDGDDPVYPKGSPEVCSTTPKCRQPDDIWDAPEGYFGTGFDDGPFLGSPMLYDFLEEKNIGATHFMIGMYIRADPATFLRAFNMEGADIAVHTYSHLYMTTLSNEDVLAQLAWTMQIIHDTTGGRVPRYWRPPYGDADNRVRAIAKEVLGMQIIMWNQDTEDWSMGKNGGTTKEQIAKSMTEWLTGPKTTGLMVLEHELNNATVQAFIDAVPEIEANGWKMVSQARLADGDLDNGQAGVWQNAADSTGDVNPQSVGASAAGPAPTSTDDDSNPDESSDAEDANATINPGNNSANDEDGDQSGSLSSFSLPSFLSLFAALILSSTLA